MRISDWSSTCALPIWACRAAGYPLVVLDDLSKGARRLVPAEVPFYEGDVGDSKLLAHIFSRHRVGAVMHFAGAIVVPESMAAPLTYYLTNPCKTRSLLQSCVDQGITRFVFSSTAHRKSNRPTSSHHCRTR